MLRNRSRAVTTTKQPLMAEPSSLPSPTQNQTRPISSFLGSPRFFNGVLAKNLSDTDTVISTPTSILDDKQFCNLKNPFGYPKNSPETQKKWPETQKSYEKNESEAIGLALVDSLIADNTDSLSKPSTRMVLFGSNLKIHIPPLPPSSISPVGSPNSPADFGIKTSRNSHQIPGSPFGSAFSGIQTKESPKTFTGALSLTELELSEDYTRVISHGPNPKTIHIYDDCVLESCCGVVGLSELKKQFDSLSDDSKSPSLNFLSVCYTCKKDLGEDRDIYMYRGEKAFCSHECRFQEMLFDGVENSEVDGGFED